MPLWRTVCILSFPPWDISTMTADVPTVHGS
jgi:hypothetical protein